MKYTRTRIVILFIFSIFGLIGFSILYSTDDFRNERVINLKQIKAQKIQTDPLVFPEKFPVYICKDSVEFYSHVYSTVSIQPNNSRNRSILFKGLNASGVYVYDLPILVTQPFTNKFFRSIIQKVDAVSILKERLIARISIIHEKFGLLIARVLCFCSILFGVVFGLGLEKKNAFE